MNRYWVAFLVLALVIIFSSYIYVTEGFLTAAAKAAKQAEKAAAKAAKQAEKDAAKAAKQAAKAAKAAAKAATQLPQTTLNPAPTTSIINPGVISPVVGDQTKEEKKLEKKIAKAQNDNKRKKLEEQLAQIRLNKSTSITPTIPRGTSNSSLPGQSLDNTSEDLVTDIISTLAMINSNIDNKKNLISQYTVDITNLQNEKQKQQQNLERAQILNQQATQIANQQRTIAAENDRLTTEREDSEQVLQGTVDNAIYDDV